MRIWSGVVHHFELTDPQLAQLAKALVGLG